MDGEEDDNVLFTLMSIADTKVVSTSRERAAGERDSSWLRQGM